MAALAAALLALVMVATGCRGRGSETTENVAAVAPTPVTTPGATSPVASRARALEVIRTRIADRRQRRDHGGLTPDSQPTVAVEPAGSGTASAPELGLEWTGRPAGLFDLEDARAYCAGLVIEGTAAWRLPQIWELEVIARSDPTVCAGGRSLALWSATPAAERGVETWDCDQMKRSERAVGMGHVVCARQSGG